VSKVLFVVTSFYSSKKQEMKVVLALLYHSLPLVDRSNVYAKHCLALRRKLQDASAGPITKDLGVSA